MKILRPNTQTIYKKKTVNSRLVLEKHFKELTDRDLKGREMETRREIEQLFFKPCIVSIDDMDKFEGKEMMKMRPFKKNMW